MSDVTTVEAGKRESLGRAEPDAAGRDLNRLDASHAARFDRELQYQRDMAERFQQLAETPVDLKIAFQSERRWWNGAWSTYDRFHEQNVRGKKVLVVGCGFGEDAIRLALMGADVEALDISPDMVEICKQRAARFASDARINFRAMPVEYLDYADGTFDLIVCLLVMHHVDIPTSMAHLRRVAKPDGVFICQEPYMFAPFQRIRHSSFVDKHIWRRLVPMLYGRDEFPLADDERKLTETDLEIMLKFLQPQGLRVDFYNGISGRFVREGATFIDKLDRIINKTLPIAARFLAGMFVITGRFAK